MYKVRVINFFLDVQVDAYYRSVLHVDMRPDFHGMTRCTM